MGLVVRRSPFAPAPPETSSHGPCSRTSMRTFLISCLSPKSIAPDHLCRRNRRTARKVKRDPFRQPSANHIGDANHQYAGTNQTRRLARLTGNRSHCRCVFLKRVMDPIHAIIEDVIADQTTQMKFIEDDHVIQKFSATTSGPAFRNSILPRTCSTCAGGFHGACSEQISNLLADLPVTIENRVAVRARLRKCLPVNSRSAPAWIFLCHLPDESSSPTADGGRGSPDRGCNGNRRRLSGRRAARSETES